METKTLGKRGTLEYEENVESGDILQIEKQDSFYIDIGLLIA